jgi:chromosome partitioning protein
MKSIAFFNNKGGVGKTTLVYHIAYMMAELGYRVLVADLDPQANVSSMFLSEQGLYDKIVADQTIVEALKPFIKGTGDIEEAHIEKITESIDLLVGNLELSAFEDELSKSWGECLDKRTAEPALRKESAFFRIMQRAAQKAASDFILIDVGPNLGAINRASLIAADFVVVPVSADLFSVQGISNVGKTLVEWREEWQERIKKNPEPNLFLPLGTMKPLGYIISQQGFQEKKPVKAYANWSNRIPNVYHDKIMGDENWASLSIQEDAECLSLMRHYRSLMPMAMEVNKPIFLLKPADGAIGAHYQAVQEVYKDFKVLTLKIIQKIGVSSVIA